MPFNNPCPRGFDNCEALTNVESSTDPDEKSFVCVGYNKKENRVHKQDRFRHCWVSAGMDVMTDMDRRDFIDTLSVISQALSLDENIRVYEEISEEAMNELDLIEYMRK